MLEKSSYYPGQQSKEEIVLFIRQHKFAYVKWAIILLSLLILPPIAFFLAVNNKIIELNSGNYDYFILIASAYLLFLLALFLTTWIEYYLNVAILTRTHLIHIRQSELFTRSVSEQSLLRVQDVSSTLKGFFSNLLKFGDVYVETAGEEPNFILTNVANPNAVAKVIMEIHEELVTEIQSNVEIADGIGEFYSAKVKQKKREINLEKGKIISIQKPEMIKESSKSDNEFDNNTIKNNLKSAKINKKDNHSISGLIIKKAYSPITSIAKEKQSPIFSKKNNLPISYGLENNEKHDRDAEGEMKEGEEIKF